ncbi:ARS-binding factor 1-like isoform X3 [Rhododendron vialii]|uniref:ARS-binding factor 1-like isoform X3 n=1 Tax=Rhododendron vialii TaxID=182163 RepID=UPI00265DE87A|nr:ARS-binding factor 1-like isoform X3 [Rhododendron vialii]
MVVMANIKEILTSAVFIAILSLIPKIQSQSNGPPVCITQLAQLNRACAFLPYTPPDAPPSPPDDDGDDDHGRMDNVTNQSLVDDDDGDDHHRHHHHHHHHHHRHRHSQGRRASDAEDDCCTMLNEVDAVCVCSLLLRLPLFLSKPEHNYSVIVNDECEVTFECRGIFGD